MKTTRTLLLLTMIAMTYSCSNPPEDAKPENEAMPAVLTKEAREHAAADWQQFRKNGEDRVAIIQQRINSIRKNIFLATAKEKVKIRRVMNKTEFKLAKLEIRLREQNQQLQENISTYGTDDLKKLETFKKDFDKKINRISAELDDCKCDPDQLLRNSGHNQMSINGT